MIRYVKINYVVADVSGVFRETSDIATQPIYPSSFSFILNNRNPSVHCMGSAIDSYIYVEVYGSVFQKED